MLSWIVLHNTYSSFAFIAIVVAQDTMIKVHSSKKSRTDVSALREAVAQQELEVRALQEMQRKREELLRTLQKLKLLAVDATASCETEDDLQKDVEQLIAELSIDRPAIRNNVSQAVSDVGSAEAVGVAAGVDLSGNPHAFLAASLQAHQQKLHEEEVAAEIERKQFFSAKRDARRAKNKKQTSSKSTCTDASHVHDVPMTSAVGASAASSEVNGLQPRDNASLFQALEEFAATLEVEPAVQSVDEPAWLAVHEPIEDFARDLISDDCGVGSVVCHSVEETVYHDDFESEET